MIIVYGIKNCDTVKKALKWLTEHNIQHKLHDYRVDDSILTTSRSSIWLGKFSQ